MIHFQYLLVFCLIASNLIVENDARRGGSVIILGGGHGHHGHGFPSIIVRYFIFSY
jgi:hypothetical protein